MRSFYLVIGLSVVALMAVVAFALGFNPEVAGTSGLTGLSLAAVAQSAYGERQALAVAGMIANPTGNIDADTFICDTAAGIGFGVAVAQGTADKTAILAGVAGDFLGASVKDVTLVNATADKYARYQNMGVLRSGDIWVNVDGAVNAGDNVTYSTVTGLFGTIAADGTHLAVTGGRWMTTAADTGLARLRLSGHAHSA